MKFNFWKNFLNKPESQRKKIMWVFIFVIIFIILICWFLLLSKGFVIKNTANKDLNRLKGELKSSLPEMDLQDKLKEVKNQQNELKLNEENINLNNQEKINEGEPRLPVD